jgi:hypothetical protein
MKNRKKMPMKQSKKEFSRTADRTHRFNNQNPAQMMRGGIRM